MLSKIYTAQRREEGFTLIELLIVVIIIGILAAIALPIFIDQQKVAIDASVQSDVRNSVTNITNAQAQNNLTDVKAAVSREGTTLHLTAPAVGTAAAVDSSATKADAKFATIPVLGSAYVLAGQNDGGKKFTTASGKAFTFTAVSGQFSTADAAGAAGGTGGGSAGGAGGGSYTPPAAEDGTYYGSTDLFAFDTSYVQGDDENGRQLIFNAGASNLTFYANNGPENPITNSTIPIIDGVGLNAKGGYVNTRPSGLFSAKLYNQAGQQVGVNLTGCAFGLEVDGVGGEYPKGAAIGNLTCDVNRDLTAAERANIAGGKVVFTFDNKVNTIPMRNGLLN